MSASEREFDDAFGFGTSSSRNIVPETQLDPNVVEGTAADVSLAAGAILRLNNAEGYLSDDLRQYEEEEYAQPLASFSPPAIFSPLSSSSRRSSRSASPASSASSRSSSSSGSSELDLPLTTAQLKIKRREEAALAVVNKKRKEAAAVAAAAKDSSSASSHSSSASESPLTTAEIRKKEKKKRKSVVAAEKKKRKDAVVAVAEKERKATMITPVAVPDSITKKVASPRRSCSVEGRMDFEERNMGSGKRRNRKKSNGKGRASRLSPQFDDVSDSSHHSEMSHPSVTKENKIDRLVVAYIGSKKCLNVESKRTLLAQMIKEPSNIYFLRKRGVHLEDIFSRNEDTAAKAGRWGIPFVSSALFRLAKAIQQEDEDESSNLRQRLAATKTLRLVDTARHKVLSELEEKKERKLREKEKAKKRINSAAGRKHHGLTFDRDRVSHFLYIILFYLN